MEDILMDKKYYWIIDGKYYDKVYKQAFADNEAVIKISKGDSISITYEEMEDGIHYMTEFSFVKEEKEVSVDVISDGAITGTE